MNRHQEFEQLSAYVDGELDAAERAQVETHVGSCADCRGTLEALRATVTELRAMPEPEPTPQDSWALRAAIARARRQPTRWQRWAVASSSAAAAAVLIVGGILLAGGDNPSALSPQSNTLAIEQTDFDATTARALLEQQGMEDAALAPAPGAPPTAQDDTGAEAGATTALRAARGMACERALFEDQTGSRTLRNEIVGTFEGKDAYLLVYHASDPDRLELWVVARDDCKNVLFFARREL